MSEEFLKRVDGNAKILKDRISTELKASVTIACSFDSLIMRVEKDAYFIDVYFGKKTYSIDGKEYDTVSKRVDNWYFQHTYCFDESCNNIIRVLDIKFRALEKHKISNASKIQGKLLE